MYLPIDRLQTTFGFPWCLFVNAATGDAVGTSIVTLLNVDGFDNLNKPPDSHLVVTE